MTTTPTPEGATPGIGRADIPLSEYRHGDSDDAVLMHDDLEELSADARAIYCSLTALVVMLRGTATGDGTNPFVSEGVTELIDGVRLRAELVMAGSEDVLRTVLAWEAVG